MQWTICRDLLRHRAIDFFFSLGQPLSRFFLFPFGVRFVGLARGSATDEAEVE